MATLAPPVRARDRTHVSPGFLLALLAALGVVGVATSIEKVPRAERPYLTP